MKTSIPTAPPSANPEAGTRSIGKSNDVEATLRKGSLPKSQSVTDAKCEDGVARKCIDIQVQGDGGANSPNGDPKRRSRSSWGVDEPRPGKA
jgi:hypothetical protein